jgi:hypothetical protein
MALPRETILGKLLAHMRAHVATLPEGERFKVRHWRFRNPTKQEMPCVSLRYIADDAQGVTRASDDAQPSTAEEVYDLGVNLIADSALPPEVDEEEDDLGDDPTGLGEASRMIEICLDSLFVPGEQNETLDGTVRSISYDGSAEDDDESKPDNVRLAERLSFEYATRAEAPHILLLGE